VHVFTLLLGEGVVLLRSLHASDSIKHYQPLGT
jgi:hypothetical protein